MQEPAAERADGGDRRGQQHGDTRVHGEGASEEFGAQILLAHDKAREAERLNGAEDARDRGPTAKTPIS